VIGLRRKTAVGGVLLAAATLLATLDAVKAGAIGPDIAVSGLAGNAWDPNGTSDLMFWGVVNTTAAYTLATTSCNIGDMTAQWAQSPDAAHPVIAQNIYRLKDGRFEQVGLSWVKHGFCAVNESTCGDCESTSCVSLGIGCADTYFSGLNGDSDTLGPRSEINVTAGTNPGVHATPTGNSAIRGKVQIRVSDVEPASNAGALYFAEGQYVAADDTAWGNDLNNISWRQIEFPAVEQDPLAIGDVQMFEPALYVWQVHDPEVRIITVDAPEVDRTPGSETLGRYNVGVRVTDNGDGTWCYEYAVHNQTSDRSMGSFTVTLPNCGQLITNQGFSDVRYHSGEIYDGTNWTQSQTATTVAWSTVPFATDPNANALRWATLYAFRFDADRPPALGEIQLGMFKPGDKDDADSVSATVLVPSGALCPGDCGQLPGCGDGVVNVVDLLALLGGWGGGGACDGNGDGTVNVVDLLEMLGRFGDCS
jgi:hypothetical protein